jgi:hypothetical protein
MLARNDSLKVSNDLEWHTKHLVKVFDNKKFVYNRAPPFNAEVVGSEDTLQNIWRVVLRRCQVTSFMARSLPVHWCYINLIFTIRCWALYKTILVRLLKNGS